MVGGEEAVPHSMPWMALIVAEDKSEPLCGGSVISDRYVLSAAHCFGDRYSILGACVPRLYPVSNQQRVVEGQACSSVTP